MISFRRTIRGRLLFLAIAVELLMLTILVANSLRLLHGAMTTQARLQAGQMYPVLKAALTAPMAQRDYATVQAVINESRAAGGVDYITIVDTSGNRAASNGWPQERPLPAQSVNLPLFKWEKSPRYDVVLPITYLGQPLGTLHFGLNLSQIMVARRSLLIQGASIAAIELLLSTIILIFLVYWITRHLTALTEASIQVASGNLPPPLVPEGEDDVGKLGAAFNTMSRAISDRVRDLHEQAELLQQEVDERRKAQELLLEQQLQLEALNLDLEQRVADEVLKNREKDQALLQSEKMASIGQLAAGVAHEINNPLAVIRGNAELLQVSIPGDSADREEVDAIVEEATRIGRIVNNLRVFSRGGMQRVSHFSLGGLLDGILDQIGHQIPLERYRIVRDYRRKEMTLDGDEDQLRQVFTNLIVNGLEAMPEGGDLVVDAGLDAAVERVCVTVSDHGSGIRPEDMGRLFTPFFSTKPQGTGLGLAVSYGIVSDHGGEITVSSSTDDGTTFIVLLPSTQDLALSL